AAAVLLLNTSLPVLALVMALNGFLNGPLDIALFTLRQRRTDPAWTGRAFAISMSFNYVGIPVGAAIAGMVVGRSLGLAIAFGVAACILSAVIVMAAIPAHANVKLSLKFVCEDWTRQGTLARLSRRREWAYTSVCAIGLSRESRT